MKIKTNLIILIAILAAIALIFQSCKKEDDDDLPSDGIIITEEAKIIEEDTWNQNFVAIDSTNFTLTFSINDAIEKIKVGDIIVSSEGEGLLRRVTSIEIVNNEIIIRTGEATLTELIQQGLVDFEQQLTIPQIKSIEYYYDGIVLDTLNYKDGNEAQFDWNINTVLYDDDGNPQTTGDQIKLAGNFGCDWKFIAKIDIGLIKGLKEVKFGFESNENVNLQLIAGLQYDFEKKYTLAKVNFTPILVMVGVVPLVFTPQLKIVVGIDGYANASITTGVTQSLEFEAGLQYLQGSGWNSYKNFDKSFDFQPPQLNFNAGAEAYLKPELTIKLFAIAGPYANLKLYGKLDADLLAIPWWQLYGGLKMAAGVKVEILDRFLLEFTVSDLLSYEQLIAEASIADPPIADFYADPTSGIAPLEVVFTDQSTNNPTSWEWDFGDGNTSTQSNPSHTYISAGSYTVSLTVSNVDGTDTESKLDYIVVSEGNTNTPPTAVFTVTPESGTTSTNFAFDASGCSDNETPTSQLQVRWDFDGDGSWDTNWDTNKTQNHQYSIEATYAAKVEVKDPEGLTDEYIKSISVSNGSSDGCGGQTNFIYGGQTYQIVEIGNQCWMAENLNYQTSNSWWYENSSMNGNIYGRLYTWDAALTACPSGWSLPSDEEWKSLEAELGMSSSQLDLTGYRGSTQGTQLKENGSSNFEALLSGLRSNLFGDFSDIDNRGFYWTSSSVTSTNVWFREFSLNEAGVGRFQTLKNNGLSIRCIKH